MARDLIGSTGMTVLARQVIEEARPFLARPWYDPDPLSLLPLLQPRDGIQGHQILQHPFFSERIASVLDALPRHLPVYTLLKVSVSNQPSPQNPSLYDHEASQHILQILTVSTVTSLREHRRLLLSKPRQSDSVSPSFKPNRL